MQNNKKTIAFFNGFYIPHLGGVERYTNKLAQQLKENYNIIIVTSNDSDTKNIETIDGIKIYRLPVYGMFKNRYPILRKNKEYKNLLNQILDEKIDYLICNTRYYQTSILGAKVSKIKDTRLLLIDHSSNHMSVGNKILDKCGAMYENYLTNTIKKYNPKVYGVSKKSNEWLKYFNIEASGVFYNSIDDELYQKYYKEKEDDETVIISYIGRIIPEKGVINLLDAFEQVNKTHKNIRLIIAGDGNLLNQIKEKYTNKNIVFKGKIPYEDVMKLCVQTDIFVHPSMYSEGLPTSILEAGIMKTAIVATDRGGTCEVINDEKYGLIVEENTEDLVEKLNYLLDNPEEITKLKDNIHERIINNFTWKQTAKVVEKELEKYE
ncbi:MAG: hypothetical protein BZ135_07865 [Methanosphaera sp. rholeuAM6]|nr:MAG: hypothetical protein BZ135_07865 [Methanosphaera sp. rholeuAM6]